MKALVAEDFAARGITIVTEGELKSDVIDEKQLIDQHYYAIASKVGCCACCACYAGCTCCVLCSCAVQLRACFPVRERLYVNGLSDVPVNTKGRLPAITHLLIHLHAHTHARARTHTRAQATILKPAQLNVPADKFKGKFGLEWADALASGRVLNAADGCKELGVDSEGLNELWVSAVQLPVLFHAGGFQT